MHTSLYGGHRTILECTNAMAVLQRGAQTRSKTAEGSIVSHVAIELDPEQNADDGGTARRSGGDSDQFPTRASECEMLRL